MWTLLLFVVWTLTSTIAGQLVQVETAYSSDQFIYTCSRQSRELIWDFERNGVERVFAGVGFTTAGDMFTRVIDSATIYFNVTSASDSFVSVTATINDTSLNGIRMSCGGDTLDIEIMRPNPPSMLEILRKGRNLSINPLPQQNGIIYSPTSYSGTGDVILNGSTTIFVKDVVSAFNLTFNCINGTEHFIIGGCIFDDSEDRNYTLLQNGSYIVTQQCEEGLTNGHLICNSDGNWHEDITCKTSTTSSRSSPTTQTTVNGINCSGLTTFLISTTVLAVVVIIISIVVVILVIVICNCWRSKMSVSNLHNIELPNTISAKKRSTDGHEGYAIDLVDNAAYGYIATK